MCVGLHLQNTGIKTSLHKVHNFLKTVTKVKLLLLYHLQHKVKLNWGFHVEKVIDFEIDSSMFYTGFFSYTS